MWSLFRKKPAVGVDIGDFSIEVVRLDPVRKTVVAGRVTFGESVIQRGRVVDRAQLTRKLSEVLGAAKPKPLAPKRGSVSAVVSLPESQTFTHVFEVDLQLSGDKLREHVLDAARGVIPLKLERSRWDFEISTEKKSVQRVVFVSSPSDVVEEFVDVLQEARLNPVVIDTELVSISRAVLDREDGPTLLMDLGANRTLIGIVDGSGTSYVSLTVPIGGKQMTQALVNKMGTSQGEAEKAKREHGFSRQDENSEVKGILQQVLDPVVREAQGVLHHYNDVLSMSIERALLVGGVSLTPDIEAFLSERLGRDVKRADPTNVIQSKLGIDIESYARDNLPDSPVLFTTAIGLAIRGAQQKTLDDGINLLERHRHTEEYTQAAKARIKTEKHSTRRRKRRGERKRGIVMNARSVAILVFFAASIVILAFALYKYVFSSP